MARRSNRLHPLHDLRDEGRAAAEWRSERDDDEAEIRFSLTALGEAALGERERRPRFRGFGPCGHIVA